MNIQTKAAKDNITKAERVALQQLKVNKDIVIKEADKGGVIVIMTKEQYKSMAMKHLNSNAYERIQDKNIDKKVMQKIEEFTENHSDILEEWEIEYLTDFKYTSSNFYILPKIHKSKEITELVKANPVDYLKIKNPPEVSSRPIVAGTNSPTHRLSKFLDIILRPLTDKVKSYVRDDMDFLKHLPEKVNFDSEFITLDVTSLYTNITHERGIEALEYWIDHFQDYLVEYRFTKEFIIEGLRLVLENNYFKFNDQMWHQLIGTTMGSNVSVIYAILFMAFLELKLYQNIRRIYPEDYADYLIRAWKRFIDDCFIIWNRLYGFEPFLTMVNSLDSSINFTVERDCNKLPFPDIVVIKNSDNTISTDIFYKPTNSHRYLDFRSCHRHHTKVNVPFNLAQRICKIVSSTARRQYRLKELKSFLTSCFYPEKLIDEAIKSAKEKDTSSDFSIEKPDIIPLVITHNPNHAIDFQFIKSKINNVKSTRLQRSIKNKPLLATRQPPNLKRLLTKAEFRPDEELGVVPCKRSNCDLCSFGYLRKELEAKSSTGATLFKLNKNFNCNSKNILYLLTCTVCKKQYVGKTENCRFRMNNHKKDVRNPKQKTIFCDKHFKNCLMENYGELKEPLFFCTPFLYVKDPVKRHNLEQFYIKKFKAELNR